MSKVKKVFKAAKQVSHFVLPQLGAVGGFADGLIQGNGLKGALQGGLKSGLSAALQIGGSQLAGSLLGSGAGKLGSFSNLLNGSAGLSKGAANLAGFSGSGTGLSSLGSLGNLSSFIKPASTIFSSIQSTNAQDEMKKQLLAAQGKSEAALSPYLQSGADANAALTSKLASGELGGTFTPGDLTQDPGYQFRLQEGQKALNRSLGASGNLFSGRALTAAQDYGQGLADSTYNDAYQRWLQGQQNTYGMYAGQAGQGLNAANSASQIYDNQGNINANATLGKSNILNSTLSSLLSGSGARRIVGYKADGSPIYEPVAGEEELVGA